MENVAIKTIFVKLCAALMKDKRAEDTDTITNKYGY